MATQPSGQPPRRPARTTNNGANGNGGVPNPSVSKATRPVKPSTVAGRTAKFIFTPEIGRSFEGVKFAWHLLVNLIAQIYAGVGLIDKDHPSLNLRNASQYRLQDIVKIAYRSLKWEREQVPQIIIFFAVLAFLFFIALSMVTFVMNLGVNVAHAQAIGGNGNAANDVLNQIFNVGGTGMIPTAFGKMLQAYSTIVLVLAGLILIWMIVTYVVESARHGQAGGKGFNHGWAPMRLVFALGLLIPLSSGLNSGQYITLYLAKWGSDMATKVYQGFSKQIGLGQGVTANSPGVETQKPLAQLFDLYLNAYRANDKNPGAVIIPHDQSAIEDIVGKPNYKRLVFRPGPNAAFLGNQKGVGEIDFYSNPTATGSAEKLMNEQFGFLSNNTVAISNIARSIANTLNPQDDTNYFKEINTGAFKASLQGLAQTYSQTIEQNYTAAVSDANADLAQQINQNLTSLGWVSAPIMYQQIGQMNGEMQRAKNELPEVIVNGNNMSEQLLGNAISAQDADDAKQAGMSWFQRKLSDMFGDVPVLKFMFQNGGARLYKSIIVDNPNPYTAIIGLGQWVLTGAEALLYAWPTFAFVAGLTSSAVGAEFLGIGGNVKLEGLPQAVEAITPIVSAIIGMLFVNGYMLGMMFPLIPIFRFIFAVVGWLALVLVAVMGMPLFALAHLKTGGEGWVGQLQVASAYNMLIGIIIRPTLIIIGFILGMVFFNFAIKFAGTILLATLDANSPTNLSLAAGISMNFNFITQVLSLFMFSSFAVAVANACFKLVDIIPSQAMTWMGTGPQSSPTEDGTNEVQSATQSFAGQYGQLANSGMQYRAKISGSQATEERQKLQIAQDGRGQGRANTEGGDKGESGSEANTPTTPSIDVTQGSAGDATNSNSRQSMQNPAIGEKGEDANQQTGANSGGGDGNVYGMAPALSRPTGGSSANSSGSPSSQSESAGSSGSTAAPESSSANSAPASLPTASQSGGTGSNASSGDAAVQGSPTENSGNAAAGSTGGQADEKQPPSKIQQVQEAGNKVRNIGGKKQEDGSVKGGINYTGFQLLKAAAMFTPLGAFMMHAGMSSNKASQVFGSNLGSSAPPDRNNPANYRPGGVYEYEPRPPGMPSQS